jgi:hypothetical protein
LKGLYYAIYIYICIYIYIYVHIYVYILRALPGAAGPPFWTLGIAVKTGLYKPPVGTHGRR